MKPIDSNQTIRTIPEGVWEASHHNSSDNTTKQKDKYKHQKNISTDLQGNGYPNNNS